MQRALAHTLAGNRMGYPILPTLHTPPLSSPGKQSAPNFAPYQGAARTLPLNSLLDRKGYFQRWCQPESRVHRWHTPKNRRKPRSGFCIHPGTFDPNAVSSTTHHLQRSDRHTQRCQAAAAHVDQPLKGKRCTECLQDVKTHLAELPEVLN